MKTLQVRVLPSNARRLRKAHAAYNTELGVRSSLTSFANLMLHNAITRFEEKQRDNGKGA